MSDDRHIIGAWGEMLFMDEIATLLEVKPHRAPKPLSKREVAEILFRAKQQKPVNVEVRKHRKVTR